MCSQSNGIFKKVRVKAWIMSKSETFKINNGCRKCRGESADEENKSLHPEKLNIR